MFKRENWITQRWVNNQTRRYYEVRLCQNLFGEWVVRLSWGGIGNRLGGEGERQVADYPAALAEMEAVSQRRRRHGYERVRES